MNRTILLILLFLLLLFVLFSGARYFSNLLCPEDGATNSTGVVPATTGGDAYCGPWSISDTDAFSQSSNRYIRFARDEYDVVPYAQDLENLINETSEYLIANQDRSVTIVGVYDESESNASILPDLGLARADAIKSLLEELGVESANINTESTTVEGEGFMADTLCHGAEFRFGEAGGDDDRIGAIGDRLSAEPVRLYFDTDAKEPNLDAQNRQDLADIIFYLDKVSSSRIEVSGHTDNIGKGNERLSRKRAEYTAEYLASKGGISAARMDSKGYGDSRPIADNGSEDGRSQNRRVEVILLN